MIKTEKTRRDETNYIACNILYRGDVIPTEVFEAIKRIKSLNKTITFPD